MKLKCITDREAEYENRDKQPIKHKKEQRKISAKSRLRIKKKENKWEEEVMKERGSNLPKAVEGETVGAEDGMHRRYPKGLKQSDRGLE